MNILTIEVHRERKLQKMLIHHALSAQTQGSVCINHITFKIIYKEKNAYYTSVYRPLL